MCMYKLFGFWRYEVENRLFYRISVVQEFVIAGVQIEKYILYFQSMIYGLTKLNM